MKKDIFILILFTFLLIKSYAQTYYGLYENNLPTSSSNARLNELKSQLGKKPGVWMRFMSVGDDLDVNGCNALIAQGITPIITLEPYNDVAAGKNYGKYDNVIAGYYDDYWKKFADQVKQVKGTIFLRYAHEMNGNWYDWDGYHNQNNADAPIKYVLAWKHIYNIIKTQKQATNILWTWCVNGGSWPNVSWNQAMQYYPGSDYVDWISFDAYDKPYNYSPTKYQTVEQLFGTIYNTLTAAIPDKPILVAEFASENYQHESDPHKADFFSQGSTLFEKFPRIHAFSYFNIEKVNSGRYNNYKIDNPATLVPIFKANWIDNKNVISGNAGIETIHQYKVVPTTGTLKIEAENYFDQYGIITESCDEGGFDAGSASIGDYMDYLINVSSSGTYKCNLRIATAGTTGKIEIRNQSGTVLGSYTQTVATGGWQKYEDHSVSISLTAGKQKLRVYYAGGGLNLNWLELTKVTNTAPKVSFTSPVTNSVYVSGTAVKITSLATDADAGDKISKVEFYDGTATIPFNTLTVAPYDFTWSKFATGSHTITAKAYDMNGATTSATVIITVKAPNTAPKVSFTSPVANSVYVSGIAVKITNLASDIDAGDSIKMVEYYDGTATIPFHTEGLAPYDFTWSKFAVGSHTITAKAYDMNGASTSATVIITIKAPNTAPIVSFTAPVTNSSYVFGEAVKVTNLITDIDAGDSIKMVEYYDGTATTPFHTEGLAPYDFTWSKFAVGSHTISAKAYDMNGASTSATVIITIKAINIAPTVSFTSPVANSTYVFGAPVKITNLASDIDAGDSIKMVEYYDGTATTPFHTEGLAPYDFTWSKFAVGTHIITAKAYDTKGTISTTTVNITVNSAVNARESLILDESTETMFRFYPNPASEIIYFSENVNWDLIDMTGTNILSGFGNSINTSEIRNGMYIIKVNGNSYKVVIQ